MKKQDPRWDKLKMDNSQTENLLNNLKNVLKESKDALEMKKKKLKKMRQ